MASPLRVRGSVIFVADLPAMTKFYRAVTAWLITERGKNHIRLGMDGQELVIHKAFGVDAGEEVGPRVETPLKLVLLAEDASISETVEAEGGRTQVLSISTPSTPKATSFNWYSRSNYVSTIYFHDARPSAVLSARP